MNEIAENRTATLAITSYKVRIAGALETFDVSQLLPLLEALRDARESLRTVFVAGNGGSSSTAGHYTVDWGVGAGLTNPPLKVLSLSESAASITATGNDLAFSRVFSRQLENLAAPGDLLIAVSASGNSPNLVDLVNSARAKAIKVASITGFDGGLLRSMSDISIHVPTNLGDYGVAEDVHLMIGHMVKEALLTWHTKPKSH